MIGVCLFVKRNYLITENKNKMKRELSRIKQIPTFLWTKSIRK